MLPSSERPQQQLGWREAALAALACAVLASAVLYQPLFAGRCTRTFTSDDPRIDLHPWARAASGPLPPINPISPDVDAFVLPGMMRARQIEESGRLPWWDGSQALGYPLVACIPFPFFSPATWLTRPLDPMTALDWMLWFHFALAALLAYRACRAFGASPPAAAAGAVGFALSAWVYTRWQSPHEVYTISWWPAQVLAVEWLRQGRFRRAIIEGALATGLMMLSGFPQVAFVLAFGTILFATLQRSLWNVRAGFVLAAALLIGLALGLPQMLLSGDAYESSLRSAPETRQAAAERGLAPAALATAVLPELFGHPPDFSLPDAPAQTMEAWLPHRRWLGDEIQNSIPYNAFYCGVLVLLLLPLAFRRALAPFARRLVLVSLVAFAACLVGPALMRLVPGADVLAMGNIKRMLALVAACWPVAGALVLQAILERRARPPWKFGAVLLLLVACAPLLAARLDDPAAARFASELGGQALRQAFFIAASLLALWVAARRGGPWRWVPAAVLLSDLSLLCLAYNPSPPEQEHYPRTPSLARLSERPGRICVFAAAPNVLPSSLAGLFGIRSIHGILPMVPARGAELVACLEGPLYDPVDPRVGRPLRDLASLTHPLLDLLNVDTVVHADRDLAKRTGLPVLFEDEQDRLGALARPTAGPRAFLCGGAALVEDAAERLSRLADRAFPVHETVLVERPLPVELPSRGAMQEATLEKSQDGRHVISLEARFPGVLVLAEGWDPGWSVTVDGEQAELRVADHALLGVFLEAGVHQVVFEYSPRGLGPALAAAGAALALLLALLVTAARL